MAAQIIDGLSIAAKVKTNLSKEVFQFINKHKVVPKLAVLMLGDNAASSVYVNKKIKACEETKMESLLLKLPAEASQEQLIRQIKSWNSDDSIHGILVQLPLPEHINVHAVFDAISPFKDVDVFNPLNVGLLVQNRPRFLPCTPHGIHVMLKEYGLTVEGKHVVVINRSDIVGKPLSSMLIQDNGEYGNASVTVCHDKTSHANLKFLCSDADVIIVAVGIPGFFTPDMAKPHHVLIDVGISKVKGKIVGDIHPEVYDIVSFVSKVPGGVGPMTVAMLMENTFKAAILQRN